MKNKSCVVVMLIMLSACSHTPDPCERAVLCVRTAQGTQYLDPQAHTAQPGSGARSWQVRDAQGRVQFRVTTHSR